MALTFAGANTDAVNHGAGVSMADLQACTYAAWIKQSANSTTSEGVLCRGIFGNQNRRNLIVGSGGTTLNWTIDRATQDSNVSSNAGLTTGQWYAVFAVFDTTNGAKIYWANMSTGSDLTDVTTVSTAGSGSANNDNGASTYVGNIAGGSNSFRGDIATAMMWNRALSMNECRELIYLPRKTSGCVLFTHCGMSGTATQPDLSGTGNSGTVTGAVVAANAPFQPLFGFDRAAQVEASAAVASAYPHIYYQQQYGLMGAA